MLEESAGAFAGRALSFLPETSFKAPPLPGWLVGCDPASKPNLSVFALAEFMIERTSDIHDFLTLQKRKVLTKKKQLYLLRLGVRTAGLPEVEAEADKRSGSSGQAAT
jgi:hypothetical protein